MKKMTQAAILASTLIFGSFTAMAEVVVVVNAKNATGSMSLEQVSQYFLGRSTTFTPVDQAENSAIRAEFYKKIADKEPSQVKSIWSKLVFTGKGTLPKEYGSSSEVKKAVASNPNGIGYIDKSDVDGTVKVVATLP